MASDEEAEELAGTYDEAATFIPDLCRRSLDKIRVGFDNLKSTLSQRSQPSSGYITVC